MLLFCLLLLGDWFVVLIFFILNFDFAFWWLISLVLNFNALLLLFHKGILFRLQNNHFALLCNFLLFSSICGFSVCRLIASPKLFNPWLKLLLHFVICLFLGHIDAHGIPSRAYRTVMVDWHDIFSCTLVLAYFESSCIVAQKGRIHVLKRISRVEVSVSWTRGRPMVLFLRPRRPFFNLGKRNRPFMESYLWIFSTLIDSWVSIIVCSLSPKTGIMSCLIHFWLLQVSIWLLYFFLMGIKLVIMTWKYCALVSE